MIFLLIIPLLIAAYLVSTYNWFQTTKTRIKASIQEIGNQLKRQSDLIPNLIESVKGYMKHEKEIFEKLTEARKSVSGAVDSGNPQQLIDASQKLQNALGPIRAVLESTPQLQAAGPTTQLMNELTDTADKVMYARRTLIDLTADYNVKVVTVPSNFVAMLFKFTAEPGLKMPQETEGGLSVDKEELKTPKVNL